MLGIKRKDKQHKKTSLFTKFKRSSKLKKLFIIILISIPSLLILVAVSAEFTSRPKFCNTCHYMEPFYKSWKASKHNKITCVKCHFPPGLAGTVRGKLEGLVQVVNYLSGSYIRRRPWAEISDLSCMQSGCHSERLLHGKVNFKNVTFDHKHHLGEIKRGKKLRCTSCHSQIVQGNHMVVTETTCFLCHFKKSDKIDINEYKKMSNCKTCHHWESVTKKQMLKFRFDHSFVVDKNIDCKRCHQNVIIGDGFVPKENCYNCHFDNARLSQYSNSKYLHKIHITQHKIECMQCHLTIQHKVKKLSPDDDLDCLTCHTSQHEEQLTLFTGKVIDKNIHPIPNPMYQKGLTCASCHIYHKEMIGKGQVDIAKSSSCESCHGKGYGKLLILWKESAKKKLELFDKDFSNIVTKLKNNGKYKNKEIHSLILKIDNDISFISNGKAIHNIKYSDEIIKHSYQSLRHIIKLTKINYTLPKFASASFIPGECSNCHTGIDAINRKFENMQFSHMIHTVQQKIKCKTCHSNLKKHGELIVNKRQCNSCHHSKKNTTNCKTCHKIEDAIYSGNYLDSGSPNIMFDAGIECQNCHLKDNNIVKPSEKICQDCHDKEYVEIAKEWKNDTKKLFNNAISLLNKIKSKDNFVPNNYYDKLFNRYLQLKEHSANGIHNYDLTVDLINKLIVDLKNYKTPAKNKNEKILIY